MPAWLARRSRFPSRSCASRWVSSTPTTSSPTWSRRSADHELSVVRRERDGYDPRAGIHHADGEIIATEPRAQRTIVASDVNLRDPGGLNAMTGAKAAWVRFSRSLPGDEERQERLAAGGLPNRAPPSY